MGLMRRVESRMENAAGVGSKNGRPGESKRARSDKGSKPYVRPAELAQKLVKEMEAHKVVQPAGTLVSDCYTVYLCPEDFDRLTKRRDEVVAKLERHLAKHARAKKYAVTGDIAVSLEGDPDLELGHFGILAEWLEEDYGGAPVEGATEDAGAVAALGRTRSRAAIAPTPSRADHGGGIDQDHSPRRRGPARSGPSHHRAQGRQPGARVQSRAGHRRPGPECRLQGRRSQRLAPACGHLLGRRQPHGGGSRFHQRDDGQRASGDALRAQPR